MRSYLTVLSLCLVSGACGPDRAIEADSATGPALSAGPPIRLPAWGQPVAPAEDGLERRLLAAELRRDPDDPAIEEALRGEGLSRRRGAHALGHIGGPSALRRLATLLDGEADAAAWSAIALLDPPRNAPGAPPEPLEAWAELEDSLWERYAVTADASVDQVQALLLAIARIGGSRSVARLASDLARPPLGSGRDRYANGMRALAVLCARGHGLSEIARDAVAQGLETPDPEARRATIYALGRCARPSAEVLALADERDVIVQRLAPLLEHGSEEEQRLVWKAFAGLAELPAEIPPGILGSEPPGWRAEVEAVRALMTSSAGQMIAVERMTKLDLGQLSGPRHHVLVEALRGLRSSVANEPEIAASVPLLRISIDAAAKTAEPQRAHALAVAGCEVELLGAIVAGSLEALVQCNRGVVSLPDNYSESLAVEALLHMGSAMTREARVEALLSRAEDRRTHVAAPALAALAEVDDPRANPVLRRALARLDVAVVSAAASAIAARSVDASKRDPEAAVSLVSTVKQLSNSEGVEARIAAIEALGSLGRAVEPGVKESPTATDSEPSSDGWLVDVVIPLRADRSVAIRRAARDALLGHDALLREFDVAVPTGGGEFGEHLSGALTRILDDGIQGLRFETSAGEFVLDFRGALAPINQANLVDLAAKGYFDGLRWHRVVPGFVVQGGDPRGDGYGGPGHLVPCEWSALRYERGTVGIALAGKDTGGSQLFVTHAAQPHLDARYTVVGRVTQGLDVVDRLMPADEIRRVTLIEGEP